MFNSFAYKGQTIFYQDICNCGVTGNGGSTGIGSGTINFSLMIAPGSTIKHAFLIAARDSLANDMTVVLNGIDYTFTNSSIVTSGFNALYNPSPPPINRPSSSMHVLDITSDINPSINNYSLTIPSQYPQIPYNSGIYSLIYLVVVYEKPSLSFSSINIFLNNLDVIPITNYHLAPLNPINNLFPVGLEVNATYFCDTIRDGSYVQVNNDTIGLIGGDDFNSSGWTCVGTWSNFSYYNQTIFGLEDDTPNAFMEGTDATADIKSYVNNNDAAIDLYFKYQSNYYPYTNPIRSVILSYTTPCDTFSVNLLTEDTTVCKGAGVQLGASGGGTGLSKPAYEWLPTTGLSCSNCANPIASPDSTMFYTVRVWSTDSCSKVLPVRVKVLPLPKFTSIVTTPSNCGEKTGVIVANNNGSIDSLFSNGVYIGIASQTLSNLNAGNYTLYLVDTNSCKSEDTTVTINSVNLTNALFTLNPTTGAVPLSVSSDNQSTHATDYSWYFQDDSTTITSPSFEFDTSGTYTITLIAYNNTPDCSDTFSLQIVVYDSLQLIIPNVFTPNGDNQNDVFSIQVNAPCTGTITITNRWGNEMLSKNISTDSKQKLLIWDSITNGQKASDGVYFYSLSLRDKKNKEYHFQGFIELVR